MLNSTCPDYWVFDLKGIFNVVLVLNLPLFPSLFPQIKKKGKRKRYLQAWEEDPSLSLSKLNVMKLGYFSFNMLSFCLFCLPACPGQRLNDWEHGKSWLSHLTTINHLTLHLELVCTIYVESKEPHSHAGLTAGNIFPSHLLRSFLFKSKWGGSVGLAEWVAPVENKLCVAVTLPSSCEIAHFSWQLQLGLVWWHMGLEGKSLFPYYSSFCFTASYFVAVWLPGFGCRLPSWSALRCWTPRLSSRLFPEVPSAALPVC